MGKKSKDVKISSEDWKAAWFQPLWTLYKYCTHSQRMSTCTLPHTPICLEWDQLDQPLTLALPWWCFSLSSAAEVKRQLCVDFGGFRWPQNTLFKQTITEKKILLLSREYSGYDSMTAFIGNHPNNANIVFLGFYDYCFWDSLFMFENLLLHLTTALL